MQAPQFMRRSQDRRRAKSMGGVVHPAGELDDRSGLTRPGDRRVGRGLPAAASSR